MPCRDVNVALVARLNNITFACEEPVRTPTTDLPIHLDTHSKERAAEVERLTRLGATFIEERSLKIGPYEESLAVMKDPEGNGFCVS